MIRPLALDSYQHIVVLTGAGISVASGLKAFRGPGGIWNDAQIERYGTKEAVELEPEGMWRLWGSLRPMITEAKPNAAHLALANLELALKAQQSFTLITQNIDGLHQKAGSQGVLEIHGNVTYSRCSNPRCELKPFIDQEAHLDRAPLCPQCTSVLRPDIVLFNEFLPEKTLRAAKYALNRASLFIAIGTSGTVAPASSFVVSARYAGARTMLINLESIGQAIGENHYFQEEILGRAEEVLPQLFGLEV
ncbi:MAG: Sir2 family NAD-dependent protein deacetylase [Deinococcales bacterium]